MIRILDYIFNKDEILYFKKVDYYTTDVCIIRAVLKNGDEINMEFDDAYWRDRAFEELIEKGDK